MTNWRKKIKIKHLFTEKEDWESVSKSMSEVADALQPHYEFRGVREKLRKIPKGDDIITPCDYANKLLSVVYDIADEEKIWID